MNRRAFVKYLSGACAGLLTSSCVSSKGLSAGKDAPLFSFLFCNDLHINNEEHAAYFIESVENWNRFADRFDFVVVGGDLVEYGRTEEFSLAKSALDRLKNPYYTVVGNHDVSGEGDAGKAAYRAAFGTGREDYVIQHRGVALLFLDLTEAQRSNVTVGQHTIDWLAKALPGIPQQMPIITCSHFPMHPENPKFPVKNSAPLFEMLDKRTVLAYFSGHYHGIWQGERDGVPFFGNTCLSLLKNNYDGSTEEGYLFVKVYEDRVAVKHIARLQKPD